MSRWLGRGAAAQPPKSGALGVLQEVVVEKIFDWQGPLQVITGLANRRPSLLHRVVADVGDLFQRETFDGVKDESFTFVASGIGQTFFHQAYQLAPGRQLFRIIRRGIGNYAFLV